MAILCSVVWIENFEKAQKKYAAAAISTIIATTVVNRSERRGGFIAAHYMCSGLGPVNPCRDVRIMLSASVSPALPQRASDRCFRWQSAIPRRREKPGSALRARGGKSSPDLRADIPKLPARSKPADGCQGRFGVSLDQLSRLCVWAPPIRSSLI
jgi:hypothetical protein